MTDLTKLVRKLEWRDAANGRYLAIDDFGGVYTIDGDDWTHTDMAGWLGGGRPIAEGNHAARVVAALDAELLAEVVECLQSASAGCSSVPDWSRAVLAKLGAV